MSVLELLGKPQQPIFYGMFHQPADNISLDKKQCHQVALPSNWPVIG
jgi:hypothetical protein